MTEAEVIQYTSEALILVLLLSMPPILVATITGVIVSLLQAITQIQEQTLAFAVKLVAIVLTLYLTARWLGIEIYHFAIQVFDAIPGLSG
ncbi:EscS/YscS/HrcS family type III secretion system export apparatus protein [Hahella sp. CCB-MM4]|uniref:type III secretion system export apparatus subunit SctS n=1 Tax=Hahella sp. (strain CCB-MM4) TaxID=1926491 RepID=UPI000B9C0CC2|nr:type III secretion system export apparatus subunit SctS [Hahella sp. CCB-MM4]OZG74347.1 EscS/YscS/HrcS family type III secretion system export apparatus protein [Hahella sp. CCB-MM4]